MEATLIRHGLSVANQKLEECMEKHNCSMFKAFDLMDEVFQDAELHETGIK